MELHEVSSLSATERAVLEAMTGELVGIAKEFDNILAQHGLAQFRLHGFSLTANTEECLAKRAPSPSGVGLTKERLVVSSASFR